MAGFRFASPFALEGRPYRAGLRWGGNDGRVSLRFALRSRRTPLQGWVTVGGNDGRVSLRFTLRSRRTPIQGLVPVAATIPGFRFASPFALEGRPYRAGLRWGGNDGRVSLRSTLRSRRTPLQGLWLVAATIPGFRFAPPFALEGRPYRAGLRWG